jgi:hypothetical protein
MPNLNLFSISGVLHMTQRSHTVPPMETRTLASSPSFRAGSRKRARANPTLPIIFKNIWRIEYQRNPPHRATSRRLFFTLNLLRILDSRFWCAFVTPKPLSCSYSFLTPSQIIQMRYIPLKTLLKACPPFQAGDSSQLIFFKSLLFLLMQGLDSFSKRRLKGMSPDEKLVHNDVKVENIVLDQYSSTIKFSAYSNK